MLFLTSYISCGLGNCRGITVLANHLTPFLSLSSALLRLSLNVCPVHSVMLSSHVLLCLPLFLFPCTVPYRIVLASSDDLVTCPYYLVSVKCIKLQCHHVLHIYRYVLALLSLYSTVRYNQGLPQQTVKHRDLIQNLAVPVIKKSNTTFIKIILSIICHILLFLPFPLSRCMSLL